MRVLHTSDWHLGRMLYGRQRYEEFSAFLDWLLTTINEQAVDVLLIAGDIFDTNTPSHHAQALYYQFLHQVAASHCQHVVVIGGNHDSPSFLNAPQALLRALNVYVVGAMTDNPQDEVIVLPNHDTPQILIAAVPYLRDKDLRQVEAGESIDDKNSKLAQGLRDHYAQVCAHADALRTEFAAQGHDGIPLIGMGHLFTTGGKTYSDDGVRELYVGNVVHIGREIFPPSIDYLALGHLHISQTVGGYEHLRYCGSPIPMGFNEANQAKKVVLIEFAGRKPNITDITVPTFQRLQLIKGDYAHIRSQLLALIQTNQSVWVDIEYNGTDLLPNLHNEVDEWLQNTLVEVLRIKNTRGLAQVISSEHAQQSLEDLDIYAVFEQCLDAQDTELTNRDELMQAYREIVQSLTDDDK